MTILKGPTDAEHYRVQVGRYGERWYLDPLPASKRIEFSDATYPSISTVKKAAGQDWSFVSIKRIADAEPERLAHIAAMADAGERYDALTSINKRGLGRAAERGTMVHLYAESLLRGTTPPLMVEGSPGYDYLGAVDEFFATYNPKLVAAEYPVFHRTLNGVGYGGTPDGLVEIGGELYGIDWKTRTETSSHGAYAEEAAQIAAGAYAEYMIVEDADGHAVRQPIPQVTAGLVVSIKPDGCRVYPLDLAAGWNHWEAMHAWWCARRNERNAIGKPWAPGKRQSDAKPKKINPQPAVEVALPDEGSTVDVTDLRTRYQALPQADKDWIGGLWRAAQQAGVDFHLAGHFTARRAAILEGLVILAQAQMADDDVAHAVADHLLGEGKTVGHLDAVHAMLFVEGCRSVAGGVYSLSFHAGGHPTLVEVAA